MAKITGTGGAIAMPSGFNAHFRSFTHAFAMPEVETTGFDDGGFATFDPAGGLRVTGTALGVHEYDASSTAPLPAALADGSNLAVGDLAGQTGSMTLTFITGCTLAFSANVTNIAGSRAEVGSSESTWTFGSSGAITQAWDETP